MELKFNPGGAVTVYESAEMGISPLLCLPKNSAEVKHELMQEEADKLSEGRRTKVEALRLSKTDPRTPPRNYYKMKLMVGTYASLLFSGFRHQYPLYINLLALYRILDHKVMQEHTEKFTRAKCAQLTWQLLEESRFSLVKD